MGKTNKKKVALFAAVALLLPGLQNWATSVSSGVDVPFTAENIIVPAIPGLVGILSALFSNPRHSR